MTIPISYTHSSGDSPAAAAQQRPTTSSSELSASAAPLRPRLAAAMFPAPSLSQLASSMSLPLLPPPTPAAGPLAAALDRRPHGWAVEAASACVSASSCSACLCSHQPSATEGHQPQRGPPTLPCAPGLDACTVPSGCLTSFIVDPGGFLDVCTVPSGCLASFIVDPGVFLGEVLPSIPIQYHPCSV